MNIGNEQLIHDLEQRHISLRNEHEILKRDRDLLKEKVQSQQSIIDELNESVQSLSRQLVEREIDCKKKDNTIKEYEDTNEDIRDRLHRRSEECERLRDDIKLQAEQLISQQTRLRETLNTMSEVQSKQLPLQYDITKVTRENDILQSRVSWSEKELEDRTAEFLSVKRELTDKIFSLESQVSSSSSENARLLETQRSLKDQIALQAEKIDQYMQQTRDAEVTTASERDAFLKEIDSQKALADLYKKYFEEAAAKADESSRRVSEANEAHTARIVTLQSKHQSQIDELRKLMTSMQQDYEGKIREMDQKLTEHTEQTGIVSVPGVGSRSAFGLSPAGDVSEPTATLESFYGLSTTEVYDRIVALEKQLGSERAKRREAEIYLDHVRKTIEAQAPRITAQRRDYLRVVDSHEKVSQRLDELVREKVHWRVLQRDSDARVATAERKAEELETHNRDLSFQIQHILKKDLERRYGQALPDSRDTSARASHSSSSGGAGSVITDHLVTFEDISQLQMRNEQLLKSIRKLELDLIDKEKTNLAVTNTIPMESDEGTLQEALKELQILREGRQRLEDMLHSLRSQRDMYKAMLDEADSTIAAKTGGAITSASSDGSGASVGRLAITQSPTAGLSSPQQTLLITGSSPGTSQGTRVQELQRQISQLEDEKEKIRDRMNRIEETGKAVSEALTAEKQENSTLRMQAAHASSEAKFQASRATNLEQALASSQKMLESVTCKRAELEGLLVAQQKEAKLMEEHFQKVSNSLRGTQESLRRTETALEASRSAEQRLVTQLSDLRTEMQKQCSLSDSILRIEAGLSSRTEEDMASLIRERDDLLVKLEGARKHGADRVLVLEQRLLSMEEDVRVARLSIEQREKECGSAREAYLQEQGTCKAAQERSSLLERQLAELQLRYDQVQGNRTVESISVADTAQLELALERANAEVESLRLQLSESQGHADQFRRISVATEATLKELRERSATAKEAQEQEQRRLASLVQSLQTELAEKRQGYALAIADVEAIREELSTASKAYNEQLKALEQAREESLSTQQQLSAQIESLKLDTAKFQTAARGAHTNYERELQLHAQAASNIKGLEEEVDKLRMDKSASQQMYADQSVAMMQMERLHDEEKKRFANERAEFTARLEDLQRTNELLHSQVQGLGTQVDKLYVGRLEGTSSSAGRDATADSPDELVQLRTTSSQLREVVGYMKRERDTLEAKLSVSQNENTRHVATVATLQRLLDETRSELKQEMEKRATTRDESEFSRVMLEVTQLNIVRESNAHLRSENETLSRQLKETSEALQKATHENIPLTEKIRSLETSKTVLEAERSDLSKDAAYWKDRLHQLVSRYNDVDPEEHRQLNQRLVAVTESSTKLQEQLSKTQQEKSQMAASWKAESVAKDTELSALKTTLEKVEKNLDTFRQTLRKKNQDFKDMEKRTGDLMKENVDLTKRVQGLQQSVHTLTTKVQQQASELSQRQAISAAAELALATAQTSAASVTATAVAATSALTAMGTPPLVVPGADASAGVAAEPASKVVTTTPAPAAADVSVAPAAIETEEVLRQRLLMSRNMKKAPPPAPPTSTPAASAETTPQVTTVVDDAAKEGDNVVENEKEVEPPQKRGRLVSSAASSIAIISSPMRTVQPLTVASVEKMDVVSETTIAASVESEGVAEAPSQSADIPPTSAAAAPVSAAATTPLISKQQQQQQPPGASTQHPIPHGVPPTSGRFAKLAAGRGKTGGVPAAQTAGRIAGRGIASVGVHAPVFGRGGGGGRGEVQAPGSVDFFYDKTKSTGGVDQGTAPTTTTMTTMGSTASAEESGSCRQEESETAETHLDAPPDEEVSRSVSVLNPNASTFVPTQTTSRESASDLFIDVGLTEGSGTDPVPTEDHKDESGDMPVPGPPATSPFLDIRPPSPASAAGGKLVFGGKPTANLPMPSGLPSNTATQSSSPFSLKPTGESLFGFGFNKSAASGAGTGTGPFSGTGAPAFGTMAPSTSSFLATSGAASSASSIIGGQPRSSSTIFGFTAPPTPVLPAPPASAAAASHAPTAPIMFGPFSGSSSSFFKSSSVPPMTHPSTASPVAAAIPAAPVSAGVNTAALEMKPESTASTLDDTEGDGDAPLVSLSATKAMTIEERNRLRRAKFAALGAAGGTGSAATTTGAGAANVGNTLKKRTLSQNSVSESDGTTPVAKLHRTEASEQSEGEIVEEVAAEAGAQDGDAEGNEDTNQE